MKPVSIFRSKLVESWPWLLAGQTAVLAGLSSNVLWDTLTVWREGSAGRLNWMYLLILLAFVASIGLLYRVRNAFFRPRTRFLKDVQSVEARKYLVVFLSHLNTIRAGYHYEAGVPSWFEPSSHGDFIKDTKALENKKGEDLLWNWQMPLTAIHRHRGKLEKVVLICSDSKTSIGGVHHFVRFCRRYEGLRHIEFLVYCRTSSPRLLPVPEKNLGTKEGFDFDSFEQLSGAVWGIIAELKKDGARESEIMIDFTGGKKVTSIVAASATFNRRIIAQYVNTRDMRVTGYDVILSASVSDEKDNW
jgi:hypothetical protein